MQARPLSLSLGLVGALLDRARRGFAVPLAHAASNDLFVDLPAFSGGAIDIVTPQSVQVIASLYFLAEVEGTFLPSVAEELARNRFALNLTDRNAAEALETLARAMDQGWVERTVRNQIYARVFGIGQADPNLGDTVVNREFESIFARFCAALAQAATDLGGWGAPAGAAMRTAVAAQMVMGNLGDRMQGNTLIVTERLSNQLRLSINALNHPGLTVLFMGRTAWDVVRGVLGPETPDMARHVNRGQTGLRLLTWLSAHLDALRSASAQAIIDAITAEPGLPGWSEVWLDAAGIRPMGPGPDRPGSLQ